MPRQGEGRHTKAGRRGTRWAQSGSGHHVSPPTLFFGAGRVRASEWVSCRVAADETRRADKACWPPTSALARRASTGRAASCELRRSTRAKPKRDGRRLQPVGVCRGAETRPGSGRRDERSCGRHDSQRCRPQCRSVARSSFGRAAFVMGFWGGGEGNNNRGRPASQPAQTIERRPCTRGFCRRRQLCTWSLSGRGGARPDGGWRQSLMLWRGWLGGEGGGRGAVVLLASGPA